MKKDWTYKKLGEVADTYRGLTYSKKDEVEHSSKAVLRSNNIDLTSHQLNFDEIKYIREDFVIPQDKLVKKDSIFICMSNGSMQHLGKVAYIDKEYNFAFGGFMGLVVPKEIVNAKYVYYSMLADNFLSTIMKEGKGANINNLRFSDVENYLIPIPPLSIQRSIVAELDLLHSVISKKKEQLRELDNLAQSLFYQMFGDPITNPMGWEIKKLGEVAENCDFMRKPITASDRIPGNIPYYGASGIVDYVRDYIFDGDYLLVSEDGANLLARSTPIAFSISGKNWVNNHAHVLKFQESSTQLYVQTLINLIDISDIVTGAVQPKLNQAQLNKFHIPLPPLSLQQSFAAKVSAIEAQKQAITQSIHHTEALLAQRMDQYFA